LPVLPLVRGGEPGGVGGIKGGVPHAERFQHPVAHHILERRAAGPGGEHAEHLGAGLVQPALARLGQQRQLTQPASQTSGAGVVAGCGGPNDDSSRSMTAVTMGQGSAAMNMAPCIPNPQVKVSRSRTVTGRSAGTVSASGPSGRGHPAVGELGQQLVDRLVQLAATCTASPRATAATCRISSIRSATPWLNLSPFVIRPAYVGAQPARGLRSWS
jgi:hypothetical protein